MYEIYLMTLNDAGGPGAVRRLTRNDVQEGHLAFSYDGKWAIFSSEAGGINDEEPLVQSVAFAGQMYGEMYAYRLFRRSDDPPDGEQVGRWDSRMAGGEPVFAVGVVRVDKRRSKLSPRLGRIGSTSVDGSERNGTT